MIIVDSPITGKQESLTQAEFNSYMAQTNGTVLKWVVNPVLKHQEHDQSSHGNWATGQKGGSGLSHREMFELKRNRQDPFIRKVYEAEEKNHNQIQDKNAEQPSAPNRADFD